MPPLDKDTLKKALKKTLHSYDKSNLGGRASIFIYYSNSNMFSGDNSFSESIDISGFAERLAKELNRDNV